MAKESSSKLDDTIVCRCEEISLADIRQCIADGAHTLEEVKRRTRSGMGPCQGRTCRPLIAREIARMLGADLGELKLPTFRHPIKPIKLGPLASADIDEIEEH